MRLKISDNSLKISFSVGSVARKSNGAVMVHMGDLTVFVSTTMKNSIRPEQDFFPLTVDYREKFFAVGRFPGGYSKREGRPNERETLISRLCDRSLRPLFPEGFMNEVQIIGMLLSSDFINEPDVLMVNGSSAALHVSNIPWNGPIGCVRIGQINNKLIVNPTNNQLFESDLDLIYVGSFDNIVMIEGNANQINEVCFSEALDLAHKNIQDIIKLQQKLFEKIGKPKSLIKTIPHNSQVIKTCQKFFEEQLYNIFLNKNKLSSTHCDTIVDLSCCIEKYYKQVKLCKKFDINQIRISYKKWYSCTYRNIIGKSNRRMDGRSMKSVRSIVCETELLPQVHGSALFQRGNTQTITVLTLGTNRDSQDMDGVTIGDKYSKSFIVHYNFPPFAVGETGRFGFISRREIGHGSLTERSLLPIIPDENNFAYTIRLVSEVMESDGSSSMASVCGGTLCLMDAGVPIISPVAGVSAGLIREYNKKKTVGYNILTDISGEEDQFGDMDFKIAGTRHGITGFQLDIKIIGLPVLIAKKTIHQLTKARHEILNEMKSVINKPNTSLKLTAPIINCLKIEPNKIGMLIGQGGKTIKKITESTGVQIDIDNRNSGNVRVYSRSKKSLNNAIQEIKRLTSEINPGKIYMGTVRSIKEFGVFVECIPGKEGMIHISELNNNRVDSAENICRIGDKVLVECILIDERSRVRLSRKSVLAKCRLLS